MTDPSERPESQLESHLASLRPARLSPHVADRIAGDLADDSADGPMSFADRCLAAVMAAGALAACVVVGLVTWQVTQDSPTPAPAGPTLAAESRPATLGQYQQALAQSSDALSEIF